MVGRDASRFLGDLALAPSVQHHVLDVLDDLLGTAPRQRDAGASVAVVEHDLGSRYTLQQDVVLTERAQPGPHVLVGVQLQVLERRDQVDTPLVHL